MNQQEKIEQAAETVVENLYQYCKQSRDPKGSAYDEGYLDAIDVQGEFLFKEGAEWALNHQWISVDEELPEADGHGYSEKVFVRQKYNPDDIVVATYNYNAKKWNHISPTTIHDLQVTHWMAVPPLLEGGEK